MNDQSNLWTVEHPMTVMMSPAPKILTLDIWFGGVSKWDYSESYIYNAWEFKSLELETINYFLPLN